MAGQGRIGLLSLLAGLLLGGFATSVGAAGWHIPEPSRVVPSAPSAPPVVPPTPAPAVPSPKPIRFSDEGSGLQWAECGTPGGGGAASAQPFEEIASHMMGALFGPLSQFLGVLMVTLGIGMAVVRGSLAAGVMGMASGLAVVNAPSVVTAILGC